MAYPTTPGFNFDDILNLLARGSARDGNPNANVYPGGNYQYFWNDHPEKNKTVMSRYESFGGQAEPLNGEIGRESSGYSAAQPNYPSGNQLDETIARLPEKFRRKYLHMLGQVRPNFEGNSAGSWR